MYFFRLKCYKSYIRFLYYKINNKLDDKIGTFTVLLNPSPFRFLNLKLLSKAYNSSFLLPVCVPGLVSVFIIPVSSVSEM